MSTDPKQIPRLKIDTGRTAGPASTSLAVLLAVGMLVFLLVPIALAISSAFQKDGQWSLYWFGRAVGNEVLRADMLNSVLLACATTAASLAVAVPLAVLRTRCRFFGGGVLGMLLLVPMILPPFVGALSMRRIFSQFGVLNQLLERIGLLDFGKALPPDWLGAGFAGVVFLQTLHLFPILYLNASAALANVDPTLTQAARNLGAGPWQAFRRVTLPLMRPGLFAGGTIVFIWAFTDVGTPVILNCEHLIPVRIFKYLSREDPGGLTYSLVLAMLAGSVGLYILGKVLFGRSTTAESSKASLAAETRKLGLAGTLGAWLLFGGVIVLAVLPHVGVVLTAVAERWVNTILPEGYTWKHLAFVVTHPATYRSLLNSLQYAGISTAIDLVVGCLAAWLIVRARVRGRNLLDGVMMLPLAVPGMILAAGYVALTAKNWFAGMEAWSWPAALGPWFAAAWQTVAVWLRDTLGAWLVSIGPRNNPFILLVIAYAVRRVPFVVRGVSAGLEQVPVALEEAARNLGSSRPGAFRRVTLPLITANLVASGVLTFTFAMLEVSDSLILAQTQDFYPITKQLYELATSTGSPETGYQAAALGVYGMALLGGAMAVAGAILGRRLGAIFRA